MAPAFSMHSPLLEGALELSAILDSAQQKAIPAKSKQ